MKQKLLLAALCLICAMLLYGCGSSAPAAPSATPAPSETPAPTAEVAASAESPAPSESAAPVATLPDAGLVKDTGSETSDQSLFELAKSFVDKPLSELQEEIGDPISSTYVSSCLIPGGEDGELQYDGFIVSTVKSGDSETILDVREGE